MREDVCFRVILCYMKTLRGVDRGPDVQARLSSLRGFPQDHRLPSPQRNTPGQHTTASRHHGITASRHHIADHREVQKPQPVVSLQRSKLHQVTKFSLKLLEGTSANHVSCNESDYYQIIRLLSCKVSCHVF